MRAPISFVSDAARQAGRAIAIGIGAVGAVLVVAAVLLFAALPDANLFNERVERIFVESAAMTAPGEIRLLEILATRAEEPEEVFAELPKAVSTPELKVLMAEGEPHAFIEAFVAKARFDGARLSTIDGVRADWPDGWGLVRASNTTPILVLRFEADTEDALARVQAEFRTALLAVRGDLALPF